VIVETIMRIVMLMLFCGATPLVAANVNFDDGKAGAGPGGWTLTKTGKGEPRWSIEKDDTAPSKPNVLKQSGAGTYPLAIKEDANLKDGFVEVKFKPLSGEEDQAGGIIWRCKDVDNYYICRANALENNVRIYHFVNGKRTQFKGANLPVAANQWHTLRVNFAGNRFVVIFDGKELFAAEDDTIPAAGKVGVWTKADSVTLFDDFSYGEK
jgi:3-keto-disaccharide hydrolase